MRLTCIVCRDFLLPSEDVSAAQCGHFFHYPCWLEWLERSKTCPQCRKKTNEKLLIRLFFNVAEGEGEEVDDAASMNNKIDSLTFNLRLKEKDLATAKEELEKEATHNKGLREEIKKYKSKIDKASTYQQCMEEKVRYLQQQGREAEDLKNEVTSLRTKLDRLQRMDKVLHGNVEDVQKVLDTTNYTPEGMRSLALFTSSLKKALEEAKDKREQLREAYNADKLELRNLRAEVASLKRALESADLAKQHLEGDIHHLENEKKALSKKIKDLEQAILSPTADSSRDKALRRFIAESPAPESLKRARGDTDEDITDDENYNTPVLTAPGRSFSLSQPSQSSQNARKLDLEGSPFLGVKPLIVKGSAPAVTKGQSVPGPLSKLSIFKKRLQPANATTTVRHTSQFGETYDGLGGHSKVDEFPTPSPKVIKKPKVVPSLPKKKLSAPAGVPKLDQFSGFINLDL